MVTGSFLENKENGKHKALCGKGGGGSHGVTEEADAGENSLEALIILPRGVGLDFCSPTLVIFRVARISLQGLCPRRR